MHWQRVVNEFGELLYRTAYQVLHDHGDAEDVVQDVLLEAFHKHRQGTALPTAGLLCRMVMFRAIDRLRRRRTVTPIEDVSMADSVRSPDDALQQLELADRLRQEIARLPERQAECFLLRHVEGLSNEEIAGALDISASAVSTALHKARSSLHRALNLHVRRETR